MTQTTAAWTEGLLAAAIPLARLLWPRVLVLQDPLRSPELRLLHHSKRREPRAAAEQGLVPGLQSQLEDLKLTELLARPEWRAI